jgi:hypothetical protein
MNFGRTDLTLLVVMSLAIVIMAFVFPAIGLSDASADENDIPNMSVEPNRFDMAGDFPDRPGTPTSGIIERNEDNLAIQDGLQQLEGTTIDGYRLSYTNVGNLSHPKYEVTLDEFDNGNLTESTPVTLSEEGDQGQINEFDWTITLTLDRVENVNQSNLTAYVEYEIEQDPDGQAWYTGVPILGSFADATSQVASMVGWLGIVIWWTSVTIIEIALNLLGLLFDVVKFGFGMASWLVTTYSDVISNANSWAAVFVALPGIILSFIFAKLTVIGIKLLPTT